MKHFIADFHFYFIADATLYLMCCAPGDIGYVDEKGYLFVVDRLKELVKYKGYQVIHELSPNHLVILA